jgi:hypothetical protein
VTGTCIRAALGVAMVTAVALAPAAATDAPPGLADARAAVARGDAAGLLRATMDRYRAMRSFVATGESVKTVGSGADSASQRFDLRVARDGRYRITWAHADGPAEHAIWNDGQGGFSYASLGKVYTPDGEPRRAFAVAAGISSGLTRGVPPLVAGGESWFEGIEQPALGGVEAVEGEPCWIVSGATRETAERTLWISTERLVVRRHRWSAKRPPEHAAERQREEEMMMEGMKRQAAPGAQAQVDLLADLAIVASKYRNLLGGTSVETYRDVRVDDPLDAAAFVFELPPGAALKRSLSEDLFRTDDDAGHP